MNTSRTVIMKSHMVTGADIIAADFIVLMKNIHQDVNRYPFRNHEILHGYERRYYCRKRCEAQISGPS